MAGAEEEAALEGDEEEEGACSLPRGGGGEISHDSNRCCASGEDSDRDDAGADGFDGMV